MRRSPETVILKEKTVDPDCFNRFEFKSNAMTAKDLEKVRIAKGNRIYSDIVARLLGNTPQFSEITKLRRSKDSDRTETAALIKIAILEGLKVLGLTEEHLQTEFEDRKKRDKIYLSMVKLEKEANEVLADDLKYIPVYTGFLSQVIGMGDKTSGHLLATLGDITRFEDPSSLWHYCGMGNAETDKKRKNVECSYNPKMKSLLLGIIGENLLRAKSQYNVIYYERTERTKKTHPEWWHLNPDGSKSTEKNMHPKHGYRDGIRVMTKRFLCELWKAAYIAKGIVPPRNPYILNNPNHHLDPDIVSFDMSLVPVKQRKPMTVKTETKVDVYAENNSTFMVEENHSHLNIETQVCDASHEEIETQFSLASLKLTETHHSTASQTLNENHQLIAEDVDVNEC